MSCSTPTEIKCKAALRTVQTFPFFSPTSLCKETHLNHFNDFLLDAKLKDPVDTLLTVCHHAEDTRCNNEPTWANKVQTFTNSCTVCYASCNTLELSYAYCISLGCLQSIEQCKYTSIHIYKYQSIIIHVQGDFFNWDPQFQYQKENRDISQS